MAKGHVQIRIACSRQHLGSEPRHGRMRLRSPRGPAGVGLSARLARGPNHYAPTSDGPRQLSASRQGPRLT